MTVHYPRSFLGLLLAGFTLVIVPLVAALAYSAWSTERLAVQSRNAVFNASQAARASRSLVERIGSIERLAQQLALLDDPELAVGYARVHRGFKQLAGEIAQLPLDDAQAAALERHRASRSRRCTTCSPRRAAAEDRAAPTSPRASTG